MWTGFVSLRIETSVLGSCEYGNEPWGTIKYWEVLEWLTNCWLLKGLRFLEVVSLFWLRD
jgi:hypothetical protein